eukprot:GDKJ01007116.1.p1 GENE.GDKJ01007116.1~~GDKJ01007116.1.p1  ORF type:complete len:205 (-),score=46.16 GDKJ01007116.1:21-578(-)
MYKNGLSLPEKAIDLIQQSYYEKERSDKELYEITALRSAITHEDQNGSDLWNRHHSFHNPSIVPHIDDILQIATTITHVVAFIPPPFKSICPGSLGHFLVKDLRGDFKMVDQKLLEIAFPVGVKQFFDRAQEWMTTLMQQAPQLLPPPGTLVVRYEDSGDFDYFSDVIPTLFPLSEFVSYGEKYI